MAFSYSNKGLLTKEDFIELMNKSGYSNVVVYEKEHKTNNQNKLANKGGKFIDRENDSDVLVEYLFVGKK